MALVIQLSGLPQLLQPAPPARAQPAAQPPPARPLAQPARSGQSRCLPDRTRSQVPPPRLRVSAAPPRSARRRQSRAAPPEDGPTEHGTRSSARFAQRASEGNTIFGMAMGSAPGRARCKLGGKSSQPPLQVNRMPCLGRPARTPLCVYGTRLRARAANLRLKECLFLDGPNIPCLGI
eukprot:361464-Chlamydomonas_euryale.AAC.1